MAVQLRQAYGQLMAEFGEQRDDFVVVVADTGTGTGISTFMKKYPERSFNVGLAEQNMMGVAAGLSTVGFNVFVNTYGVFASCRAADQVRNSICYPNLNVKIVASHVGLDAGDDGATHQSVEDMAIMCAIPNMIVLVPADAVELKSMLQFLLQYKGPAYMRTTRAKTENVHPDGYRYELGKATVLQTGSDVTVIACGIMVQKVLAANNMLRSTGISADIVNCSTIKPIDEETIVRSIQKTKAVVTVEDHSVINGLGGAVSQLAAKTHPVPIEFIGIKDRFGQSGDVTQLYSDYGMSERHIAEAVERVIRRKGNAR